MRKRYVLAALFHTQTHTHTGTQTHTDSVAAASDAPLSDVPVGLHMLPHVEVVRAAYITSVLRT